MKTGVLSKLTHRRIWNSLLLMTFLVAAVLGLLLAIQVNYKLEWTIIKTILKWHVDFGIGMSFIAIFHFTWHWKFYTNIFKRKDKKGKELTDSHEPEYTGKPAGRYLILLTGFLSMVIQVLIMREITTVFQGNEILMIWTLGIWMLLNGAGVWLGSQIKIVPSLTIINRIILIYSLLPIILIPLLNILRNIVFPPGVLIHPAYFFLVVVVLLLPICLLTGTTFALLIKNTRKIEGGFIRVYAWEAIGCMAGGLISSFVLLYWLSIIQSLLLIGIVLQLSLYFLAKSKDYLLSTLLIVFLFTATFVFPINNFIKSKLYSNQKVVDTKETFYGNVTITRKSDQYNFYENGNLLFTSQNEIISEEYVHYVMLQHDKSTDVLLVSGGVSGMLDEILKYPNIKSIEYIELNPELVRMAEKYFPIPEDERIHIIFDDVRKYVRNSNHKYDIIIIALPDPASLQINRMYTAEFVKILSQRMKPGGVVIYGLNPSGNYLSNIQLSTSALMYNTLQKFFRNVIIIPGERDYYLASDSALSTAIASLWSQHPIENLYVNSYYIDDYSISERSKFIKKQIANISLINTDNKPLPVFYNVLSYLSQFNFAQEILWLIIIVLLLIPLSLMRSHASGVFLAGFSGAAAELLLVFTFQVVYGFVYSAIGLIIALFMLGLVLGSAIARKIVNHALYFRLAQIIMTLYFLTFPFIFKLQQQSPSSLGWILFLIMILLPSYIIGFMYVTATKLSPIKISQAASGIYAADLLGAAAGVVTVSVVILPILGISGACFVIAVMNGIGILLGFFGYKGITGR